jgi:hypothetical protein
MNHRRRRLRIPLAIALAATFACSTVYLPQDEPLTEATLSEAIETLRDSDGRVELLEDGMVVDLFVYEWRRLEVSDWHDRRDIRMGADFGTETQYQRRLVGPKRDVYLPYQSILAVQARSWPLWSGVELELDSSFQLRSAPGEARLGRAGDGGPVVIKARDEQDAQLLSEAIDRVRRARLLGPGPADPPAPAEAADAADVEGAERDAEAP